MRLNLGLEHESFKLIYGIDYLLNDSEAYKNEDISLVCGRRDWAAFQVLLKADEDFTLSLTERTSFTPRGTLDNIRVEVDLESIPQAEIKINAIALVEDDDRLFKSDILLNDDVVYVEKNKSQCVWVEAVIPEEVQAGSYQGKVNFYKHKMFEKEELIDTLNFKVHVMDVILPKPEEHKFYLDLWQHLSNIARKHEVRLWSLEHFDIIENYIKTLSELGQKSVTIIASEIPWSGQRSFKVHNYISDMFEYSMIKVEKDVNGLYNYDFSILDRYIKLCDKYNINEEFEVFGLVNIWLSEEEGYGAVAEDFVDAIRIRYKDKSDNCFKYMDSAKDIINYIKALEGFFKERGLIDRARIVADEPEDKDLYIKRLDIIKKAAPSFKYKTAINNVDFIEECKGEITDFVPILPCVAEKWDLLEEIRDSINGRLLYYICCWPQYPNTFIKSPLLESRFISILAAFMNFDGFLRWNYTVWPEKPREKIAYNYPMWIAGDTNFVYPAWNGKPLLTLRYKSLKRGIEDFELISMVKDKVGASGGFPEEIWDKIIKCKDIKKYSQGSSMDASSLYSLYPKDYDEFKYSILKILEV